MRRSARRAVVAAAGAGALVAGIAAAAPAQSAPPVEVDCPGSPVPGADVSATEGYAAERDVSVDAGGAGLAGMSAEVQPAPAEGTVAVTGVGDDSGVLTVSADVTPGEYTVTVTAETDGGDEASCTAALEVLPLVPVGDVQGSIADDQTSYTSPLLGERVAVRGVVTQQTLDSDGNHGFFLQERADATDGDPHSSDGVFVFNSSFTTLRTETEGPARDRVGANWQVTVGDEIVLRGEVGQYFGMTQFSGGSSFVWEITATGLDPADEVEVAEVDPPDDAADAERYFRRHLGMQLAVPADSRVVAGRDVFAGTDAEVWAVRGDHPVLERDDPYAQRLFRDAHPLDNHPETDFDDGNGARFVLGSFGLKGTTGDPDTVLAPARTGDTVTQRVAGGVYLSFGKYTVNVSEQLSLDTGVDPADNAPPQPADRDREAAVAAYNVENLYDRRDSPNSGCDFPGNDGCVDEHGETVDPPFDYVPGSDAEYQDRLARMAAQVRLDLHNPDILLVQETEAQDVCTVADAWSPETPESGAALGADRLDCDLDRSGDDNTRADGRPDSLQELALIVAEQGGPRYAAAYHPGSGDTRGITTAYLYRTDRVELLPPAADDPVLGTDPAVEYDGEPLPGNAQQANPKALNAVLPDRVAQHCTGSGPNECDGPHVYSRAPQVGLFRVWRAEPGVSTWTDMYLVNNHHSAGPEDRVRQRTEQATYNARIAEAVLDADPDARVLVGGDLNVFPRPDDPYAPGQHIPGIGEGPSDQLRELYASPLTNLYDTLVEEYPSAAYTYGYQGQAQTLDHLWVSDALRADLVDTRTATINADWPADAAGEDPAYGRFGVSDHDPQTARFAAGATFDRVGQLTDALADEGRWPLPVAAPVDAMLRVAEKLADHGLDTAADAVLRSAAHVVSQSERTGMLDREVADGVAGEIDQLRS